MCCSRSGPDTVNCPCPTWSRPPGIPRATVRRYVAELLTAGALDRTTAGTYTIGLRLWRLGTLAPSTEPLRRIAAPFIEDLYSALRQHVQLAVLEGDSAW